ncbi:MAG: insulinase family protein [Gammaproteobacteria bacterium]|nr:insulinase family protein [Gammaproteobacteria bacterium]
MKIIVREDHRAPVVVSQIWYKVGASYEHGGITGVSHVLEHMMFKGTTAHPPGEFSKIISENGGRENAFTGRDYTAYFQQLEKSRLAVSFELEADRMRNLLLLPEEFAKEVKVVMEERRLRTEDNPQSLTYENFAATAFQTSPYHNPIIGWMNDLENMNIQDLQAWYKKWYAPNNATLVVAGDVNPKEVYLLAQKYFGVIPRSKNGVNKPQLETEQNGIRRIVVKRPAKLAYLLMGYQVPVLKTAKEEWEPYALEVLAEIMDGDESARLTTNLVRGQQIVAAASASYDILARLQSLFLFSGVPSEGKTVQEIEQALRVEIERVKNEPVSREELERVKTQVVASDVYEKDSVFYQAMQIGTLETIGLNWKLMDEYVERIRAVTPEQVQQVARKYLIEDHLTVAVLEPLPLENKKGMTNAGGSTHDTRH